MNLAYVHLVLNHIPIIGIPIAVVFLAFGLYTKNQPSQRFALVILFLLSAIALPVFFTGEPAEDVVKNLPGVIESSIESHEDAALFSVILTSITGVFALIALWLRKNSKVSRLANLGVMMIAVVALLSLLYTASLGGQIRHTEFSSSARP